VTKPLLIAAGALLAASLGLNGCVTVFPKAPPAQLYRFGAAPPTPDVKAAPAGAPFNLQLAQTVFANAAQSDSILTSNGTETAYLAGSRWVSPAVVLFDEAVDRAFDAAGGPARLVPRGGLGTSGASLKLDVQIFEARYSGAKSAAPTIVVRVHGALTPAAARRLVAERTFEADQPAADNRVGAIVTAFDEATTQVVGEIVAWTEVQGAAAATPATH
jgi:cholesterol transport system auxiliary component